MVAPAVLQIFYIPGPAASPVYTLFYILFYTLLYTLFYTLFCTLLCNLLRVARRRQMCRGTVGGANSEKKIRVGTCVVIARTRRELTFRRAQRRARGSQSLQSVVSRRATMKSQSAQRQVSHMSNAVMDLVQVLQVFFCKKINIVSRFVINFIVVYASYVCELY